MSEQLDEQTFTGPHPTTREFVAQLDRWAFTRRKDDGVHIVLRGPRGGTLRVLRSLTGRADAALVDKAARLVGVTVAQFWAGPPAHDEHDTADATQPRAALRNRKHPAHDRVTSLVLAAHTAADRPLGFDQVVDLCGGRVTRAQVRTASATLCRDGDLDRIRSAVYQWAGGRRAAALTVAAAAAPELRIVQHHQAVPPQPPTKAASETRTPAAELFDQLFPRGVRMTAELMADFERWAQLTDKLAANANAS